MNLQWAGALLITAGCGIFGFSMAAEYLREEYSLRQLIAALDYMFCELQYSASPLPQICGRIGEEFKGSVGRVFRNLSEELEACTGFTAQHCMETALDRSGPVMKLTEKHLRELGAGLGKFDLDGQLRMLEILREQSRNCLKEFTKDRQSRIRSYETLGLCAGAALAIILI